jgi:hypothetical protein
MALARPKGPVLFASSVPAASAALVSGASYSSFIDENNHADALLLTL